MKYLGLVSLIWLITLNESYAECVSDEGYSLTCRSGIDAKGQNENGEYICGTDCTFTIENSTIKVKANSENARIDSGIFSSWYYEGGKIITTSGQEVNFNKIELDGDFKYIGQYAFANSGATITSTSGVINIKDAGSKIARGNTRIEADIYIESNNSTDAQTLQHAKIKGDLIFAEGVTTIGSSWFMGRATIDGNVVIPSSVTSIKEDNWVYITDSLGVGNKIYCNAENCYDLFYESCYKDQRENMLPDCLKTVNNLKNSGRLVSYPYGCEMMPLDLKCIECKAPNYKLEYGYCYKVRYTMQEADAATSNDNENMIEWTFE